MNERQTAARWLRALLLVMAADLTGITLGCSGLTSRPDADRRRLSDADGQAESGGQSASGRPEPHLPPGISGPRVETTARPDGAPADAQSQPPPVTCTTKVPVYREGQPAGDICPEAASPQKLTVLDLSDDWAPIIFSEAPELGARGKQVYRPVYVALSNERTLPGRELSHWQKYLEVYGIFPTFQVIRQRLGETERHACNDAVDDRALSELREELGPPPRLSRELRPVVQRAQNLRQQLERLRRQRELGSLEELANDPRGASLWERYQEGRVYVESVAALQAHLECDAFLPSHGFRDGVFNYQTMSALRLWQKRHMIVSNGVLDADTQRQLVLDSRAADFHAGLRTLRERVVDATGLIEDGSAAHAWGTMGGQFIDSQDFRSPAGQPSAPGGAPDLVSGATEAAARALGWTGAAGLVAFFERFPPEQRGEIRVAVPLPPVPSYHSEHMDLRAEIDRGDIYYEPWFRGRKVERRPILTLYARQGEREVALIRWGTTIGGWQEENTEDGGIGQRYKSSPVGARIWRDLVTSPAWLPPESTPDQELLVERNGQWEPNFDLFGPSYRSAYGLVMMMHLRVDPSSNPNAPPRYRDEGIRTHGSVSYHSILKGYSHGCHRLFNHLAVRLAGFLLHHRRHVRQGAQESEYERDIQWQGQNIKLELSSRGYLFELTPPVPVEVLEGNILGNKKEPDEDFYNVRYLAPNERVQSPDDGEDPSLDAGAVVPPTTP